MFSGPMLSKARSSSRFRLYQVLSKPRRRILRRTLRQQGTEANCSEYSQHCLLLGVRKVEASDVEPIDVADIWKIYTCHSVAGYSWTDYPR